jgi:hypothetical protein
MKKYKITSISIIVCKSNIRSPDPGFNVDSRTAIVITDPQNDFLSPKGATWGVVGESVTKTSRKLRTTF